ncbi:MAG: TIR domain-containing protein [Myxococcales bacterium FL481]|nr:MAG: TIR domain-containing protein [Myxococcales bacterium FL481]
MLPSHVLASRTESASPDTRANRGPFAVISHHNEAVEPKATTVRLLAPARDAGHTFCVEGAASPSEYRPPRLPKELLRRYRDGDRYFANTEIDGADLEDAALAGGDYSHGSLREANLLGVDLTEARLCDADLSFSNLGDCTLERADLSGSRLVGADLFHTQLTGADLTGACFGRTALCGVDLRAITGLQLAVHRFPSFVSTDTLARSRGQIPIEFLVGCGLADWEIECARLHRSDLSSAARDETQARLLAAREQWSGPTPAVFVCHGEPDDTTAAQFAAQLQGCGVRCWRHVYNCEPDSSDGADEGDRWMRRDGIAVLLLSEAATRGSWLVGELAYARQVATSLAGRVIPVTLSDRWQHGDIDRHLRDELASFDAIELSVQPDPDTVAQAALELCERLRETS